jgi:hypothetical protein
VQGVWSYTEHNLGALREALAIQRKLYREHMARMPKAQRSIPLLDRLKVAYPHLGAQTKWFLPRKRREVMAVRSTNFPHLKQDIMASARGVVMIDPGVFLT